MRKYIPAYSGVFLDEPEAQKLREWFARVTGLSPLSDLVKDPHLTIAYKPSVETVKSMPLGQEVSLTVIGWVEDSKAQAVIVSGYPSDRRVPHITLSTDDGVPAAYSNELLDREWSRLVGNEAILTVRGRIGYSAEGEVLFEFVPPAAPRPQGVDKQTQRLVYDLKPGRALEVYLPSGDREVAIVSEAGVSIQQNWVHVRTESLEEFRDRILNERIRLRRIANAE